MLATIEEVADRAGVSKATVSRVLNQPQLVKPATRERVLAVIQELGFTANPFAQGLNTGRTYSVALIVGNLTNPYYAELAEGCDQELRRAGYQLVISNIYQDPALEIEAVEGLLKRRVAGLILGGLMEPRVLRRCAEAGVPVTIVGRVLGAEAGFDSVIPDEPGGLLQTVDHLRERGYREIACISGHPGHPVTKRRLTLLREALARLGIDLPAEWVVAGEFHSVRSGWEAMRRLLAGSQRPRAVVAMNDLLAVGALRAAHDAGLSVPAGVAVIGFDDIPLASYAWPALTTVRANNLEAGRQTARCILQRIRHPDAPPQHVVVPTTLIVRESS